MPIVFDFGTWWIESVITNRTNIAFGTRSLIDVTLSKSGRCMGGTACADFDANAARHVSVAISDVDGTQLTEGKRITAIQFNTNNHGTSDASVSSRAILFMRD